LVTRVSLYLLLRFDRRANNFGGNIVTAILSELVLTDAGKWPILDTLLSNMPEYDQKTLILSALHYLSRNHLSKLSATPENLSSWWRTDSEVVAAAAGLLKGLLGNESSRRSIIAAWLTNISGAGAGESVGIRRAAMAALSSDRHDLESVLSKSLQQFGDQLYIRHTPVIQQEGKQPLGCTRLLQY
jgi:telomere length regulation protein